MFYDIDIHALSDMVTQAMKEAFWRDDASLKLYLYCLSRACRDSLNVRELTIHPGDVFFREREVATDLAWSRSKLTNQVRNLCSIGLITAEKKAGTGTLIHLLRWDDFSNDNSIPIFHLSQNAPDDSGSVSQGPPSPRGTADESSSDLDLPHDEADDLPEDYNLKPMWLNDDSCDDRSTESVWPRNDDKHLRSISKTRPDWPDYDHVHPDLVPKTRPDQPDYDHVHPDLMPETRPDRPGYEHDPPGLLPETRPDRPDYEHDPPGLVPETRPDRPQNETTPALKLNNTHNINNNTINTNRNISRRHAGSKRTAEPEGFKEVWLSYPQLRRTHREEAAELYAAALSDGATPDAILRALEDDIQSLAWQRDDGQYIPGIVKWLQKETWRSYVQQSISEEGDEEWTTR